MDEGKAYQDNVWALMWAMIIVCIVVYNWI